MKKGYNFLNHVLNFIAVILGVYLAFYLNEKAVIGKEIKESQLFMNSLIVDLSDDIKTYEEYQIPVNNQQLQNIDKLLEFLLKDNLDSIGKQLTLVFQVENYSPTISTYNSMKSTGKLKIIDDLGLQKELSDYYEVLVDESNRKGEFQAEYFTGEMLEWIVDNVDLIELELLKNDDLITLRNKLIVYQSLIEQKLNSYKLVVSNSKKLKSRIESKAITE